MMNTNSKTRLLLIAMFTTTLISFAALSFLFIRYLSTNVNSDVPVKVLRDLVITVPDTITVGEQFKYNVTGHKDVDSKPSVRRQIECNIEGGQISETLDVVQPDNPVGKIDFSRFMTIPTYRQNLVNSNDCVIVFIAEYSFYTKSLVSEDQVYIPVSQTFRSNNFRLIVPEAAEGDEKQESPIDSPEPEAVSQAPSAPVQTPLNNDDGQANGSAVEQKKTTDKVESCKSGIDLLGLLCIGG